MARKKSKSKRRFSPAQLAAQQRFAAANRGRTGPAASGRRTSKRRNVAADVGRAALQGAQLAAPRKVPRSLRVAAGVASSLAPPPLLRPLLRAVAVPLLRRAVGSAAFTRVARFFGRR